MCRHMVMMVVAGEPLNMPTEKKKKKSNNQLSRCFDGGRICFNNIDFRRYIGRSFPSCIIRKVKFARISTVTFFLHSKRLKSLRFPAAAPYTLHLIRRSDYICIVCVGKILLFSVVFQEHASFGSFVLRRHACSTYTIHIHKTESINLRMMPIIAIKNHQPEQNRVPH